MAVRKIKLVVLVSGGGSNLQAIIDSILADKLDAGIELVASDNPEAFGLTRARNAGISTLVIDFDSFDSREDFDSALILEISKCEPDLIILAGFMRILGKEFIQAFEGKVVNIHPSLLPKFKGLNTHHRALESGDEVHGATVHYVTEELDAGPIIIQAQVRIDPDDTPETLQARVLEQEHVIYPQAIQKIASGLVDFNKPAS